ncbi:MAG TPA: hypothetical protein VHL53_04770, partial [Acidimicrobiia bacterium]|nr:hypothetical protein [Acidimicrobiia bacterium]
MASSSRRSRRLPSPARPSPRAWSRRRRLLAGLTGVLLLGGAAGAVAGGPPSPASAGRPSPAAAGPSSGRPG